MNAVQKAQAIFDRIRAVNDEPRPRPGRSREDIVRSFASIGVSPPADLVELYEWHDGIEYLNAFLSFHSLEDAVRMYRSNRELKDEVPEFEWSESWVTVLSLNGGDVQVCLDVDTGALHAVDVECDEVRRIAGHYDHYLTALLELFESGKFQLDAASGSIQASPDAWHEVAARHAVERM